MADQPPNRQNTYPLLSDVPAGPIRDSLRLLWDQIAAVAARIPNSLTPLTSTMVQLSLSANTTIADATPTNLVWSAQEAAQGENTREVWTLGQASQQNLYLPRSLGRIGGPSLWVVSASIEWQVTPAGQRTARLQLTTQTAVTMLASVSQDAVAAGVTYQSVTALLVNPPGGSYLNFEVTQNSGGGIDATSVGTRIWLARLL